MYHAELDLYEQCEMAGENGADVHVLIVMILTFSVQVYDAAAGIVLSLVFACLLFSIRLLI